MNEISFYNNKGLALYKKGKGPLVFIMPYPHASTYRPVAEGRLSELLVLAGFSIISFDPPGFCNSTRKPASDLDEMVNSSLECLEYFKINKALPVIGHSMGSFCALAFTLRYPEKVSCLTMVGGTSGWKTILKHGIHKSFSFFSGDYWLSRYYGARILLGMDNLAIHKKLDNLNAWYSFLNKEFYEENTIEPNDHKKPSPPRAKWLKMVKHYKLVMLLADLRTPVLLICGKHDRITPPVMSYELHERIPGSILKIFENSGHSPFIEEPELFGSELSAFIKKCKSEN